MPAVLRHASRRTPCSAARVVQRRRCRAFLAIPACLVLGLGAAGGPAAVAQAADGPAGPAEWIRDVKPLLGRCLACHGALRQRAGLRLDTAAALHAAGVVDPSSPATSTLVAALEGAGMPRMPPEGEGEPLSPAEIDQVRAWIAAGATGPADERPAEDPAGHWAWKAPVRPALPPAGEGAAPHAIDALLALDHSAAGITPVGEADRPTLLRRATVDLTGLPPTPEELADFLADTAPGAWERVVDRLLASPRYAERWARHWMDVWRYSDWYGSRGGNELRNSRRHIWRWRDWIVESLDRDTGYDRMIEAMLAADELSPGDPEARHALGFLGRNYYVFNRHVWLHDTVEFTAQALLGLTFRCARCHDHKYDPLSQEDYYRLRAFFEPVGVRTDPLPGRDELLSGTQPAAAPPGATLAHGLDVVFDALPDAATHLLERGDEKAPVVEHPLAPGVPALLGPPLPEIRPVRLPIDAVAPLLEPTHRARLIEAADRAVATARLACDDADGRRARLAARLAAIPEGADVPAEPPPAPFLDDDFAAPDGSPPDAAQWRPLAGAWTIADGRLVLREPGHFLTLLATADHPRDFRARIRYRTLEAGELHSVGFAFDVTPGARDWQAVYTSRGAAGPTIQSFHRVAGVETYPPSGLAPAAFELGRETTLEIAVRGDRIGVWLDGRALLAHALAIPRRDGTCALWVHAGAAEFLEVSLDRLPSDVEIPPSPAAAGRAPFAPATRAGLGQDIAALDAGAASRVAALDDALAAREALAARIDADLAALGGDPAAPAAIAAARRAEARATLARASLALVRAETDATAAAAAVRPGDDPEAVAARGRAEGAAAALAAARETAAAARAAADADPAAGGAHTAVGPVYPRESTGRRAALARWMTAPEHPLVARVAVNHVWQRHFGTGLVPSVFNFGLAGARPTHPRLLDWLAVELRESGWSLKHLHRVILTSRAYRMRSAPDAVADPRASSDPENRLLWRQAPRRMEAEAVRDGLLALAGILDTSRGGPEIDPAAADTTPRRSLYLRHTPDDRAALLEAFDAPSAAECSERRESVVPQQALALANGAFALEQSRRIAARVRARLPAGAGDDAFVAEAWLVVMGRAPGDAERDACRRFLHTQAARYAAGGMSPFAVGPRATLAPAADPALRAGESLVHVLVNSNEFLTVR